MHRPSGTNGATAVLYGTETRIDLLRRNDDQTWPDDPRTPTTGDHIALESIGFTAPIEAFYGSAR